MKLNNKGFAITGILYGLLILFALLVGSYLTVLTARKNRLDGIVENIENEYNGNDKAKKTLTQTITDLYNNAQKATVTNNGITYNTAPSLSLMNDRLGGTTAGLDDGNIRYYGSNPNNYIYFNCQTYPNTNCEVWRIIGVFDGKVKLIRSASIGQYSWDNKNKSTGAETDYGENDWTTARLMKLLNPSNYYTVDSNDNKLGQSLYYNSKSGKCYSGKNNATVGCGFTNTGIKNNTTKNMIAATKYYLGGWSRSEIYPNQIYEKERGKTVYTGRPTTWTGKIGLMYPSDYGYAVDLSKCQVSLDNYKNSECTSNNWVFNNNALWLLTTWNSWSSDAWYVLQPGGVSRGTSVHIMFNVYPVLHLDAEVKIESGDGSSSNPYKLSV